MFQSTNVKLKEHYSHLAIQLTMNSNEQIKYL